MSVQPNQIEKILVKIVEIKEKLADSRAILKSYKINSDVLKQLKAAKKDLQQQINDEIERIEDEHYSDKTYEDARNKELTEKNELKEANAELREALGKVNTDQQLSTYSYNIKGEKLKVQVERVAKVYINGKEEK